MTKLIEKRQESKKITRENIQKFLAEEYEKDHELFTGRFRFIEHKGQTLSFRFKKYKQDEFREYHLTDGETYTLPRMVIEHLNNNVAYVKYKALDRDLGSSQEVVAAYNDGRLKTNQQMHVKEKEHRCEFTPLEFMTGKNLDMMPSKVVEVSRG